MYEHVTDAEVSEYRSYCAEILTELRDNLLDKEINTQFILVGSGARNMVMRNGNGPFDLDYNHPSFVCYIEAVNTVYEQCKKRKN